MAQVQLAPLDWQPFEHAQARRIRQETSIRLAQEAPFDTVRKRLHRATTIRAFKLWAEGLHDVPAWVALVAQLPDDVVDDVVVRQVGGWNNVLNPNFDPLSLADASDDQIVVMDGDRGRDFTKAGKPLRHEARLVIRKIEAASIDVRVLERYAIENYFSQAAFEAAIGTTVRSHFPLDPDKSVESQVPGYRKSMNGDLAQNTPLSDLAGTDLGKILEEIGRRAGD